MISATKNGKWIKLVIVLIIIIPIILFNYNFSKFNGNSNYLAVYKKHINFVKESIENGAGEKMQALYPEGAFFLYSLYSLANIQYANNSSINLDAKKNSLEEAAFGIRKMEKELLRFSFLENLEVPYGVFFSGWINWAKSTHNYVARKNKFQEQYEEDVKLASDRIAQGFINSQKIYLESYDGATWPSDNVVAIASLKMHDHLYEKKYTSLITQWLKGVKNSLDLNTGMVPYQSNYVTGMPIEGPHGNSQAVIIRFLAELDPDFAYEQYQKFEKYFIKRILGLKLISELPKGIKGEGTIDSGPVIFGVGSAATLVGQIPFQVFKSIKKANQINSSINALGFPIDLRNKRKFAFGLMPVADAFFAWGGLMQVYTENHENDVEKGFNTGGKNNIYGISIVIIIFILAIGFKKEILKKIKWYS